MDLELLIRGLDKCPKCNKNVCNHTSIAANINNITISHKFNISQDLSNIFYSASDTSLVKQLYTTANKKNSTTILNRYSLRPLSCQLMPIDSKTTDKLLNDFYELNELNELNTNTESLYDNNSNQEILTVHNHTNDEIAKPSKQSKNTLPVVVKAILTIMFLVNTLQAYLLMIYYIYLSKYTYIYSSLFIIYFLQFVIFFANLKHVNIRKYFAALILPVFLPLKALVKLINNKKENRESDKCKFIYYNVFYHTLPLAMINIFYLLSMVTSTGFVFYLDQNGLFIGTQLANGEVQFYVVSASVTISLTVGITLFLSYCECIEHNLKKFSIAFISYTNKLLFILTRIFLFFILYGTIQNFIIIFIAFHIVLNFFWLKTNHAFTQLINLSLFSIFDLIEIVEINKLMFYYLINLIENILIILAWFYKTHIHDDIKFIYLLIFFTVLFLLIIIAIVLKFVFVNFLAINLKLSNNV